MNKLKTVMVSGCFDIIHGGHIKFLQDAANLGNRLVVSIAGDKALMNEKGRKPAMPIQDRYMILKELSCVDDVVVSDDETVGLNFIKDFYHIMPNVLVVTEDDKYSKEKLELCDEIGCEYVIIPKRPCTGESTTSIRRRILTPTHVPLRVDFAGGWLDVPEHALKGSYIINCTISPLVSVDDWCYHQQGGLGGSAAWSILNGEDAFTSEDKLGVGWQDPAVITETGLCVWRSGDKPELVLKRDPQMLSGIMALYWTGRTHDTPAIAKLSRDYERLKFNSIFAFYGVCNNDVDELVFAINRTYDAQVAEGMDVLPDFGQVAKKYCGGGFGGYALYVFSDQSDRDRYSLGNDLKIIEPYIRSYCNE